MSVLRRNQISYDDERQVLVIAAVAGIVAALSGASPTGATLIDIVLVAVFAGFVAWTGASAPWWALSTGAGLAVAGALPGPIVLLVVAVAALVGAAWIGSEHANKPLIRAAIAASVVQVAFRFEWNPFFLASALLAAVAIGTIAVNGLLRRRSYLRKRIYWAGAIAAGFTAIAMIGMGFAAVQARDTARDGYIGMLDGLEFVQDGRVSDAAEALHLASENLDSAHNDLGGPFTQLARFVPGVAQNRNASADVLARASKAAKAAADTLDVVDLDQLTVRDGIVDVLAFESLAAPLVDLDATIAELNDALHDAQSPWLVRPFASRLDDGIRRADQVAHQAEATAAAARIAPDMLGANGERRYFVAFVNAAEARGLSGLMGNWSEITISNGRLKVTASGRTADLQDPSLSELELVATDDYIGRYSYFGARVARRVSPRYWKNVTMAPDMPSVGNALAQMYEHVTDRPVDGVFVIDAVGIAKLIEISGPIELTDIGRQIDSSNAEEFLVLEQYEFAENEREDLLTAVTEQAIANVLQSSLPPPQQMAPILAPAVLNGHISGWAVRPDEQALFELVGMDASLPVVDTSGMDAIAVSNNNASANKIESFLQRTIDYRPIVNQQTGEASATLRVEFENNAPTSGFTDYVIGNRADLPTGTNRMLVDVYTRMNVESILIDGEQHPYVVNPELGYWVHSTMIDVPPGGTVVLELQLSGNLGRGAYQLAYRPQPLPNTDTVIIDATTSGGRGIFDFDGELERRSVLDANGVRAWR